MSRNQREEAPQEETPRPVTFSSVNKPIAFPPEPGENPAATAVAESLRLKKTILLSFDDEGNVLEKETF